MIAASRVASGQPNFGIGLELDVIAAVVIGGASLFGGQGTILGTLIGAFLIALIRNGSVLLDVNTYYQQIIIGVVIGWPSTGTSSAASASLPRTSKGEKHEQTDRGDPSVRSPRAGGGRLRRGTRIGRRGRSPG